MTGKRMLIDTSKCTACRGCMVSCKQWHSLPAEDTVFTGTYTNPPDNSGANLTVIKFTEAEVSGKLRFLFFNNRCRHCHTPFCKGACPLSPKAVIRQNNGIVRIDPALCQPDICAVDGVKPCQAACPYGIPKRTYVKDGAPVETVMRKCDFCFNRFGNTDLPLASQKPSCMVTCPPGAIMVGPADTILKKAKRRRNKLIAQGFSNANVYPPQGTSTYKSHVVWVLTELPEVYGL